MRPEIRRLMTLFSALFLCLSMSGCAVVLPTGMFVYNDGSKTRTRYNSIPYETSFSRPTRVDLAQTGGLSPVASAEGLVIGGLKERKICTEIYRYRGSEYWLTANGNDRLGSWYSWLVVGGLIDAGIASAMYSDGGTYMGLTVAATVAATTVFTLGSREVVTKKEYKKNVPCQDWQPLSASKTLQLQFEGTRNTTRVYSSSQGKILIPANVLGKELLPMFGSEKDIRFTLMGEGEGGKSGQALTLKLYPSSLNKHRADWLCSALKDSNNSEIASAIRAAVSHHPGAPARILEETHGVCPDVAIQAALVEPHLAATLGSTLLREVDDSLKKIGSALPESTLVDALERGCTARIGQACSDLMTVIEEKGIESDIPGGDKVIKEGICRSTSDLLQSSCLDYIVEFETAGTDTYDPKLARALAGITCDRGLLDACDLAGRLNSGTNSHGLSPQVQASKKYFAMGCGYTASQAATFGNDGSVSSPPRDIKNPESCASLGALIFNRNEHGSPLGMQLMATSCTSTTTPTYQACMSGVNALSGNYDGRAIRADMYHKACQLVRDDRAVREQEGLSVVDARNVCKKAYAFMVETNQGGAQGMQGLDQLCKKKRDGEACMYVSAGWAAGQVFPSSKKRAVEYMVLGCKYGQGQACLAVGAAYGRGQGVTRSGASEVAYYDKACRLKVSMGCYNKGRAYLNGHDIPRNEGRAYDAFLKACYMGMSSACDTLRTDCEHRSNGTACYRYEKYLDSLMKK